MITHRFGKKNRAKAHECIPVIAVLASLAAIAILPRSIFGTGTNGELTMATAKKPGGNVRVTIQKTITRDAARKTLERLFMKDKSVAAPIEDRAANFKELPKRRGGCIWTKRPNKVHLDLCKGTTATIKATPQHLQDLKSVGDFVEVKSA